jgi:succinyl-CoA synthetase beta subunit
VSGEFTDPHPALSLEGRGSRHAPADVGAVTDVLVRIARLAVDEDDRIAEIDVNPLMVRDAGRGAVAAGALVVLHPEHEVMA